MIDIKVQVAHQQLLADRLFALADIAFLLCVIRYNGKHSTYCNA